MAINIDELVPIDDQVFGPDEESVLETLFPDTFYVIGAEGGALTTLNNLDIYHRVLELVEDAESLDDPALREEVAAWLEDADELAQDEYDDALESEGDDDYDEEDEEPDWDE
jgi:hypothetical protein